MIADINSYVPWPGFGPFEDYEADHLLKGGEKLELAGFDIDVIHTPGHSPGHVTFSIPDEHGDLLGRRPLPGIGRPRRPARRRPDRPHADGVDPALLDTLPDETKVHPGHMGLTTLGAERATNPFLAELAR